MNAIIYLRVSTIDQARRSNEPEGYSIPAQRRACRHKAGELGATAITEYADRGASARSADRPGLQRMLKALRSGKKIDYVIIHKVDRLARNLYDDVMIGLAIRKANARLVSVTENIDETPGGQLLHGVMAVCSEFYANNLSAEVLKGAIEKAARGGTPYRAPIGYQNIIEREDGRERRTVVLDSERAPHVHWAFERYATGDYSLSSLTEALIKRGFRGRRTGRAPIGPLRPNVLHEILNNRYYLGYVTYRGKESKGQHSPLVSPATFAAAQAVMEVHRLSGERMYRHHHYLKGTLFCSECGRSLSYTVAKHRFEYFYCRGIQENSHCHLPYLPVKLVENTVAQLYRYLVLSNEQRSQLLQATELALATELEEARVQFDQQQQRQGRALAESQRLLQAYYAYAITEKVLKAEQKRLNQELEQAKRLIALAQFELEQATTKQTQAMKLVRSLDLSRAYHQAHPTIRRFLNQACFSKVVIADKLNHYVAEGFGRAHDLEVKVVRADNELYVPKLAQAVIALSIRR